MHTFDLARNNLSLALASAALRLSAAFVLVHTRAACRVTSTHPQHVYLVADDGNRRRRVCIERMLQEECQALQQR